MAYDLPLRNIQELSEEEFQKIPRCDPRIIRLKEPSKMKDNQSFFFELCRNISPDREESANQGRIYPKLIPIDPLYRGGDGLVISALNQWHQNREEIVKIPWGFEHTDPDEVSESYRVKTEEPKRSVIERTREGMMRAAKSMVFRRLEPPRKKTEYLTSPKTKKEIEKKAREELELKKSRHYERAFRSHMLQEQAHRRSQVIDKKGRLGYVPSTYDFSYDPKCYSSMEYIKDAVPLIEWFRTHNLQENLERFLKILSFVRQCFHDIDLAHCDLNPVSNILVKKYHGREDLNIFLDFGIAKGEHLSSITLKGEQLGTPESASREQIEDASERGPIDDIFACGRILWNLLAGRRIALSVILAQKDKKGRLHYDHDLVQNLYTPEDIPEEYREIFRKTWNNGYAEIIKFQQDIEEILYLGNAPVIGCQNLCEKVLELEKKETEQEKKIEKLTEKVDKLERHQIYLGE